MIPHRYSYKVLDKATQEILLDETQDLIEIRPYLTAALFEYISAESSISRLNANSLEDQNVICKIKRLHAMSPSNQEN